jgi:HAD superfamily hydrolase (TIGR01662 family)
MQSSYQVILFDLGNTLIHSINPWNGILYKGTQEFYKSITLTDPSIKNMISVDEIQNCMNDYYDQRVQDLIETTTFNVLKSCLKSKNIKSLSDSELRIALNAMYSFTQSNWVVENDAIPTLSKLKSYGVRLGIISNAADDLDVQQLIDNWGLRRYFEYIITSAACGYRKPHPLMFHKAISYFDVDPVQIIMVGDTLTADILGANRLNIFSVWINRRSHQYQNDLKIKPNAIIQSLGDLISFLENK